MPVSNHKRSLLRVLFVALEKLEDSEDVSLFSTTYSGLIADWECLLQRANYGAGRNATRKQKAILLAECFKDPRFLYEAYDFFLIHQKKTVRFCNDFWMKFQNHFGGKRGYLIPNFRVSDLSTSSFPELEEGMKNDFLGHRIGCSNSISERVFHYLNSINKCNIFILSEYSILYDDPGKNRNFSWLLSTHLNKVNRASCDILLIPTSNQVPISESDETVLDSHMVLFVINFKNASVMVYEPLQLSIEWEKFAPTIIDALKYHFPEIKAGNWKFIGDDICPMQQPNECAVTCLIVAEYLCLGKPVPDILQPRDFHNARQRFWKIAKSLKDLQQFY